jgi:hypothetical protein
MITLNYLLLCTGNEYFFFLWTDLHPLDVGKLHKKNYLCRLKMSNWNFICSLLSKYVVKPCVLTAVRAIPFFKLYLSM